MNIVTRDQWGARPARTQNIRRLPVTAVLHHSAGPATQTVRQIQNYHMDSQGWADIGYHFLIDTAGTVFQGRPVEVVGAHVSGHNTSTAGICLIGNYARQTPTAVQVAALADLMRHGQAQGWWAEQWVTRGHRDYASTVCPGEHAYRLLSNPPQPGPPDQGDDEMLQRGDQGNAVRWFQTLLNNWKADVAGTPDGKFGPKTEGAVKAYQKFADLEQTGTIGAITAATLVRYSTMYRADLRKQLEW